MARDHLKDWSSADYRWHHDAAFHDCVTDFALGEVAAKRRFSVSDFICSLRWESGSGRDNAQFKVDNSLAAAYARLLIREHPEVLPFIDIRHGCRFDCAECAWWMLGEGVA